MRATCTIGAAAMAVLAGCGLAHERSGDGGLGDSSPPMQCQPSDLAPFFCVFENAHVCGDALLQPTCVAGAWQCPAGTSGHAECWCSGFGGGGPGCTCTPSGWDCEPESGTFACGSEGLTCYRGTDYCVHVIPSTGGPDRFSCDTLPLDCGGCGCFPPSFECVDDGLAGVTVTYVER